MSCPLAIYEIFIYEKCGTCEITFDELIVLFETANSLAPPMTACALLVELSYLPGVLCHTVSKNQLSYTVQGSLTLGTKRNGFPGVRKPHRRLSYKLER